MLAPERYRLEGGIAAGGMAAVYAAHDTVLNRAVAVKVLADHLNDDVVARARFEREARAAASLSNHPGVVTIFDVGEHEGRAFIVMELRRGRHAGRRCGRVRRPSARWAGCARWPRRSTSRTPRASCTATSSRATCCSTSTTASRWRTSASPPSRTRRSASRRPARCSAPPPTSPPSRRWASRRPPPSDRYALAVVAYELLTGDKPFTAPALRRPGPRATSRTRRRPRAGLPPAAQRRARPRAGQGPRRPLAVGRRVRRRAARPPSAARRRRSRPARCRHSRPPRAAAAAARAAGPARAGRGRRGRRGARRRRRSPSIVIAAVAAVAWPRAGTTTPPRTAAGRADRHGHREAPSNAGGDRDAPSPRRPPARADGVAGARADHRRPAPATRARSTTRASRSIQAGDYEGAIEPLQQAVDACGDRAASSIRAASPTTTSASR